MNIEAGDVVRCVNPRGHLIKGKFYKVDKIVVNDEEESLLKLIGNNVVYYVGRFEKVDLRYRALYKEAQRINLPGRSIYNKNALLEKLFEKHGLHVEPEGLKKEELKKEKPILTLGEELIQEEREAGLTCASYAFKYKDGSKDVNHYTACHAGFHYIPKPLVEVVESVYLKYKRHTNQEWYKKFIDYIINRSPWKTAFLPCAVDDAIEKGVYVNVEEKHSNVVNALVALRQGYEHKTRLTAWEWFVKQGFDENTAWAAAQFVIVDGNSFSRRCPDGAHDWLSAGVRIENLVKFFKDGFQFSDTQKKLSEVTRNNYDITFAIDGRPQLYNPSKLKDPTALRNWYFVHLIGEQTKGVWGEIVEILEKETVINFANKLGEMIKNAVQVVK